MLDPQLAYSITLFSIRVTFTRRTSVPASVGRAVDL